MCRHISIATLLRSNTYFDAIYCPEDRKPGCQKNSKRITHVPMLFNFIYITQPKFSIFPFYKFQTDDVSARLAKESYFIDVFSPKLNMF